MELRVELRYENVLEIVRQMPSEQLSQLLEELKILLKKKKISPTTQKAVGNRAKILESIQQIENENVAVFSIDEMKEMLTK